MPDPILDHQEALRMIEGMKNKTGEPLYSWTDYDNGNTDPEVEFYAGQNDPTLGNIRKDRELPVGHLMIVEEIRFGIKADAAADDVLVWHENIGCLKFAPNEDARPRYFPLDILTLGGGVSIKQFAVAADQAQLGDGHQLAAFRLPIPEVITGGVPFVFSVLHNTAYNPSADTKVLAVMVGKRAYDASKAAS